MKKEGSLFLAFVLVSLAIPLAAIESTVFLFKSDIQGNLQPGTFHAVPLNKDVVSGTAGDYRDLRVFDSQGKETPFVLLDHVVPGKSYEDFAFKIVSYQQASDSEEIILERPDAGTPCWYFEIRTTARDFRKSLTILTSDDQSSWQHLTTDTLFDFSSKLNLRKTTIELPDVKAKYFKVLLKDFEEGSTETKDIRLRYDGLDFSVSGQKQKTFRIDAFLGKSGKNIGTREEFDTTRITEFKAVTEKKTTLLHLGKCNLPLYEITFNVTNAYYHRRIEILGSEFEDKGFTVRDQGTIYRFPGMARSENTLKTSLPKTAYLRFRIADGDNPPLEVTGIDIRWVRKNVYFIPEAGRTYALYFGGDQAHLPSYDLANLLPDKDRLLGCPALALSASQKNPGYAKVVYDPSAKESMEKTIFQGIVGLVVLILAFWIYSLMKQIPPAKPNTPAS